MTPARKTKSTRSRRAPAPGPRQAVLVGGVRTPFGRAGGVLEPLTAPDLGRIAMMEALARTGVAAADLDHVVMGCVGVPARAANPARVAALRAGVPLTVPALTVQRNCASGMEAIAQAATLIETGRADVVLCGGMESMSNYHVELPRSYRRKITRVATAKTALARARAFARFRPGDLSPTFALQVGLTDPVCGLWQHCRSMSTGSVTTNRVCFLSIVSTPASVLLQGLVGCREIGGTKPRSAVPTPRLGRRDGLGRSSWRVICSPAGVSGAWSPVRFELDCFRDSRISTTRQWARV